MMGIRRPGAQPGVRSIPSMKREPAPESVRRPAGVAKPPAPAPARAAALLPGPKVVARPLAELESGCLPLPLAKSLKRKAPGVHETNAGRRVRVQRQRVDALLLEIPRAVLDQAAGGEAATAQVPCPDRRMALLRQLLCSKGGPEGDVIHKALRSWRLLAAVAVERSLPFHGLPATGQLVAEIVSAEFARARREAAEAKAAGAKSRASKGGATVGKTVQEGFVALQSVLGLEVDATHPLVAAAAEPPPEMAEELEAHAPRQAASLPLCIQLQLETLAKAKEWSVTRTFARALLVACVIHHIRLNDALNATMLVDESKPDLIVRAKTILKSRAAKKSVVQLYAPAMGWDGPFHWLGEHLAEMQGRQHAVPDFDGPRPSAAKRLRGGVVAPARARAAVRDLMAQEPLCMSEEAYTALGITTHSFHGSGPDMARLIGSNGGPFVEEDARELGHWLRDKNAPQHQQDPRKVPGAPVRGQADGAPIARGVMSLHYSSGEGRRGERGAQLAVRVRLNDWVQVALATCGRPWMALPATLDSWDVLIPKDAPIRLAGLV